ncbi:S-layer homology domain-containing protein [Cohnella lupini]|uniref:S-layer family protein n=1 Tax=Cohnella lupini TaxID=1294267 RepID=A0A3D9I2X7_9BACL|nr:S-layer homology domain-containing protein [Cohnella lupini]RED56000.1 S-layer family protein [Cohnella lupini]
MKKPFKMIAMSTAAALMFGFAGQQITSAASVKDYNKVQSKDQIAALLQGNLISGNGSLQQLAPLLNALGLNLNSFLNPSSYTQNFSWYANAFLLAGFNNPHHKMTREQFTYRLVREMEARGKLPMVKPVVVEFKDLGNVSPEYAASIQRALSYGIVKLDANGKFNPKAIITRADAAAEIRNAQSYLKSHSSPINQGSTLTAEQAVQLIKQVVGPQAALQIKIDPNAVVTRESFIYLLVHTLQQSGQLPLIHVVPVEVKDEYGMDVSKSGAVQTALALGFVGLDQAGNFNPKAQMTLAQATEIAAKATAYLNAHSSPIDHGATLTAEQAVQLIKQVVGPQAALQIKIDPNAVVTRESFTSLLVHTLQQSGQLPMIHVVPVEVKDEYGMDVSNSGAVQTALALGFVGLDQSGNYNPKAQLTLAEASDIAAKATAYLKAHPAPAVDNATITAEQAVQLIKTAAGSDLQIKIDPNAVVTRESFTYLLVHTLQSSGQLPKFNLIPTEITDDYNVDILNEGAIQTALALKIAQLDSEGKFNPKGGLTLADATAMVNRAIEVVKVYSNPQA